MRAALIHAESIGLVGELIDFASEHLEYLIMQEKEQFDAIQKLNGDGSASEEARLQAEEAAYSSITISGGDAVMVDGEDEEETAFSAASGGQMHFSSTSREARMMAGSSKGHSASTPAEVSANSALEKFQALSKDARIVHTRQVSLLLFASRDPSVLDRPSFVRSFVRVRACLCVFVCVFYV